MPEKRLTPKESWKSSTKSLFFFSRENVELCTFCWTAEGLLYLTVGLNLFSHQVVDSRTPLETPGLKPNARITAIVASLSRVSENRAYHVSENACSFSWKKDSHKQPLKNDM